MKNVVFVSVISCAVFVLYTSLSSVSSRLSLFLLLCETTCVCVVINLEAIISALGNHLLKIQYCFD